MAAAHSRSVRDWTAFLPGYEADWILVVPCVVVLTFHTVAIPATCGPMTEKPSRVNLIASTSLKPACSIAASVSLFKWHPSAKVCCKLQIGEKILKEADPLLVFGCQHMLDEEELATGPQHPHCLLERLLLIFD